MIRMVQLEETNKDNGGLMMLLNETKKDVVLCHTISYRQELMLNKTLKEEFSNCDIFVLSGATEEQMNIVFNDLAHSGYVILDVESCINVEKIKEECGLK